MLLLEVLDDQSGGVGMLGLVAVPPEIGGGAQRLFELCKPAVDDEFYQGDSWISLFEG